MDYANLFCIRFDFGVPLEDIFPPNNIHPKLQNLFKEAEIALDKNHYHLCRVLKIVDRPVNTGLDLKQTLLSGELCYKRDVHPLTYLWIIRHFLGLLPLPLFTRYSNGKKFRWVELARQCRRYRMQSSFQLDSNISWSIQRLPEHHIMLIHELMKFFQRISVRRYSDKLDKSSVTSVVNYFSSSLFVRPYRPGFLIHSDKIYFYLLFYMIVNWKEITKQNFEMLTFEPKLPSILEDEESLKINRLFDCCCQTSTALLTARQDPRYSNIDQRIQVPEERYKKKINYTIGQDIRKREEEYKGVDESTTIDPQESDEEVEYEDVAEQSTSSETKIYKKSTHKSARTLLRNQLSKANRSLVNIIEKLRSKPNSLKSKSGNKSSYKYNLLNENKVTKVQSLHANNCVKESSNIKYKKLLTF